MSKSRKVKITRNDRVVAIHIPAGCTESDEQQLVESFHISEENYSRSVADDGNVSYIVRSEEFQEKATDTIETIKVGGAEVRIARAEGEVVDDAAKDPAKDTEGSGSGTVSVYGVDLVGVVLSKDQYADIEAAKAWAVSKGIDSPNVNTNENGDYVIMRMELPEGAEIKEIDYEGAAKVLIARAETTINNVPAMMANGVIPVAYGSYGWGQLNFDSMMADVEYSKAASDGAWYLCDLLDEINLYSYLDVPTRKTLVANALDSAKAYFMALLDKLPDGAANSTQIARAERTPQKANVNPLTADSIREIIRAELHTFANENKPASPDPKEVEAPVPQEIMRSEIDELRKTVDKLVQRPAGVTIIRAEADEILPQAINPENRGAPEAKSIFGNIFNNVKTL